eukprot:3412757-Rhodomonas_salina.1
MRELQATFNFSLSLPARCHVSLTAHAPPNRAKSTVQNCGGGTNGTGKEAEWSRSGRDLGLEGVAGVEERGRVRLRVTCHPSLSAETIT